MSPTGERVYCTYFDSRYLPRARAMVGSLRSVGETGAVYALCFDDEAYEAAATWDADDVIALRLSDLEDEFPQLLTVKPTRSTAEYFFTCTPWVLSLVMSRAQEATWVTYLDADLWFFRPVAPIYDELAGSNCGIIAHDYLPRYRRLEQYGRYNVGWVSFRRGAEGEALLTWWADRCLEWCQDTPQDGRFADQGYLDHFASVAPGVVDIQHPGANLAPWNLGGRDVSTGPAGEVLVNGRPLLFFHFHGLRRRGNRYIASHLEFGARANETVRHRVYQPYVAALVAAEAELGYRPPHTARRGRGLRGWALQARRDLFDLVARARGESFSTTWESSSPTSLGSR
jgi:hypothetical protein